MTDDGIIRKMDWTIDPSKIQTIADEAIEVAKKTLDTIAKTPPGKETLATLQEFEEVGGLLGELLGPLLFLKYVSTDKAQRDVCDNAEKQAR